MSGIELVKALSEAPGNKILGAIVYGRVRCPVLTPKYIKNLPIDQGYLVLVDVIAVKMTRDNPLGQGVHQVKGTMLTVVRRREDIGRWLKFYAYRDSPTTVRAIMSRFNGTLDGMAAYNFVKDKADSTWKLIPSFTVDIRRESTGTTDLEDLLVLGLAKDYSAKNHGVNEFEAVTSGYEIDVSGGFDELSLEQYGGDSMFSDPEFVKLMGGGSSRVEDPEEAEGVEGFGGLAGGSVAGSGGSSPFGGSGAAGGAPVGSAPVPEPEGEGFVSAPAPVAVVAKETPNVLVHRMEIEPRSKFYEPFEGAVQETREKRKAVFSEYVKEAEEAGETTEDIESYIEKFKESYLSTTTGRSYNRSIPGVGRKGLNFFDKFVEGLVLAYSPEESHKDEEKGPQKVIAELKDLAKAGAVTRSHSPLHDYMDINKYSTVLAMIASCVGVNVRKVLDTTAGVGGQFPFETFRMFCNNPYKMTLLAGDLDVVDCDRMLFALKGFKLSGTMGELQQWRDMLLVEKIIGAHPTDTMAPLRELFHTGYKVSGTISNQINRNRIPLDGYNLDLLNLVIGGFEEVRGFPFRMQGDMMLIASEKDSLVDKMEEIGFAERLSSSGQEYLVLSSSIEKEIYVYKKLYDLANRPTGVTRVQVDAEVKRFEANKGFQLEQLQKDGVGILMHGAGILSGCAGSGKTTVSECMTNIIRLYMPGYDIRFAAPTGKAARRMKEVVDGKVSTLHSLFRLGLEKPRSFSSADEEYVATEGGVVYIFDEMAMTNIDLLYRVLRGVDDHAYVYFLGDIKQLPPIGKGVPFKDMMDFMPCVELGVSKRSAEGSGINYNCDVINNNSGGAGGWGELVERDDFKIMPSSDSQIPNAIVSIVQGYIEAGFDKEDIQVVTPYVTPKKGWSSTNLNPLLHDIFNPGDALFNIGEDKAFRKGDRVIHTTSNYYNRKRYYMTREGGMVVLQEVEPMGVVNGEMGKVIDLIRSADCEFLNFTRDEGDKEGRDDSLHCEEDGGYFVCVEVYDPDLEENLIVLYQTRENTYGKTEFSGKDMYKQDLGDLELAYALTTHKMQGSQSPVVIVPFGSSDNPNFVSRNMTYTAISRASKAVTLVGSVSGRGSSLGKSRATPVGLETKTVLGTIIKEEL